MHQNEYKQVAMFGPVVLEIACGIFINKTYFFYIEIKHVVSVKGI